MLRTYNHVRRLRDELNLTQKEFAAKIKEKEPNAEASQSTVNYWEKRGPEKADLAICEAFGLTLAELYATPEEKAVLREFKANSTARDQVAFLRYRNLKPKDRALVDDLMVRLHSSNT